MSIALSFAEITIGGLVKHFTSSKPGKELLRSCDEVDEATARKSLESKRVQSVDIDRLIHEA